MAQRLLALAFGAFFFCAPASAQPSEAERTQALEIYRYVIGMDTSVEGARTLEMARGLADRFRAGGFPAEDVHVLPHEQTAALVVRYRGDGSGGQPIVLIAHMDVVPAHRDDWERDPFTLVEENGYFFGRGASDNKAGLTLLTATFLTLKAEGFTPTRDLILFFAGDEELGGGTAISVLNEHRALLGDPEFALNSDSGGGALDEATGRPINYSMQTAEKTYATYTLTARNPGGHSSRPRPDNAIFDLMGAIERVRGYEFPLMWNDTTIGSFRDTADMVGGQIGAAMRRFAERPSERTAAALLRADSGRAGQLRTTCVPTRLAAGHADNALPQSAVATINCRIFPGTPPADVQAQLQQLAGADIAVAPVAHINFSDASPLREDVVAAVTAAVHANYPGVGITPSMSAGATDGVFFRGAGIPTYGVGEVFMKESDRFAHGLNERNPVQSFYNGLTHWRVLLTTIAGRR